MEVTHTSTSSSTPTSPRETAEPARTEPSLQVAPAIDAWSDAGAIVLAVDLPGVRAEDVNLDVRDGRLTLRAIRHHEPGARVLASEFGARAFVRAFAVPETVDTSAVSAELKDGVLRIRLPMLATAQPRRIEVRSA